MSEFEENEALEFNELMLLALDRTIDDAQFSRLEELLADRPGAVDDYVHFIMTYVGLNQPGNTLAATSLSRSLRNQHGDDELSAVIEKDEKAALESGARENLLQAKNREEKIRELAETAFERFEAEERRRQEELAMRLYRARQRRMYIAFGCAAMLIILVGLFWFAGYKSRRLPDEVFVSPPKPIIPPVLAHISQSRYARWQDASLSADVGTELRASTLRLEQGLLEMVFKGGTRALLQAPCDVRLETEEQLYLNGGVVAIEIPEDANGFVVRTPTGTVVDYGTEFSVIVYTTGETEAQVYKGKVALRSGSDPIRSGASRMLTTRQAGRVNQDGEIARTVFQSERVFRVMPDQGGIAIPGVRLSLMDVLVGGNGFDTGKTDRMISIINGRTSPVQPDSQNRSLRGWRGTQVAWSPFIDYLFVPDGGNGPVQISSEGHTFTGCPDTDGSGRAFIAYGGFLRDHTPRIDKMILGGRIYGQALTPALAMHANRGITYDLEAIRSSLPGLRIDRFTALCGVSQTAERGRSEGCDFRVLLDGRVAFSHLGAKVDSRPARIAVPLEDNDQFLTLMVTDGGNGSSFDWGVFAEPILELEPREAVAEE